VTSGTLRELGMPVAAEAQEHTTAGVLEALVALARRDQGALPQFP
jgi:hypothetical protein